MADWKDILSGNKEELNEEELVKYLDGNLTEEEKNALELKIASSSFSNDAVEGLSEFKAKKDLELYVKQLNKDLHQHLNARKLIKEKRKLKDYPWILIAVIIVLAICIAGYAVIHIHKKQQKAPPLQEQKTGIIK